MRLVRTLLVIAVLAGTASAATWRANYTVRRGDTLSALSRRFGVPVQALAAANGIGDINLILDGQAIKIPRPGEPVPVASSSSAPLVLTGARGHVVRRGESLATIARATGTTVAELVRLNGLRNPNHIEVGKTLKLPGGQWLCPVRGHRTVVSNFGAPRPGYRRHAGNDIFAARGVPVIAPVSGVIRHVDGVVGGRAFYLAGDDGVTYYGAHLDRYTGGPRRVAAGEVIGAVGSTGNAMTTGPHLHFEIQPNGRAVDPWPTLSRWC